MVIAAATATGLFSRHNREQAALVDEALTIHGEAGHQAARAGAREPAKSAKTRTKAKSAKAGINGHGTKKAVGRPPAKKAPAKAKPAGAKAKVT